jgi:hypothetical protein
MIKLSNQAPSTPKTSCTMVKRRCLLAIALLLLTLIDPGAAAGHEDASSAPPATTEAHQGSIAGTTGDRDPTETRMANSLRSPETSTTPGPGHPAPSAADGAHRDTDVTDASAAASPPKKAPDVEVEPEAPVVAAAEAPRAPAAEVTEMSAAPAVEAAQDVKVEEGPVAAAEAPAPAAEATDEAPILTPRATFFKILRENSLAHNQDELAKNEIHREEDLQFLNEDTIEEFSVSPITRFKLKRLYANLNLSAAAAHKAGAAGTSVRAVEAAADEPSAHVVESPAADAELAQNVVSGAKLERGSKSVSAPVPEPADTDARLITVTANAAASRRAQEMSDVEGQALAVQAAAVVRSYTQSTFQV